MQPPELLARYPLPPAMSERRSVSEFLLALGSVNTFYDSPDDRCVVIMVSICISLMANDVEN